MERGTYQSVYSGVKVYEIKIYVKANGGFHI